MQKECKKQFDDCLDELLTQKEVCAIMKNSGKTLEAWRFYGKGPRYIKLSPRCVRYKRKDILEYMAQNTVEPIS